MARNPKENYLFSVSIIICAFNAEKYLEFAIKSAIDESADNTEIIYYDDGSLDSSVKIAKEYQDKLKIISCRHVGLSAARNNAINFSQGKFLSFLDADDLFTKGRVNELLSLFRKDPDLDIVFGSVAQFINPDLGMELSRSPQLITNAMPACYIGTMMIKQASFLKVGMFQPGIDLAYFMEWYARVQEKGLKINKTDYPVVLRRIHSDNLGIRKRNVFLSEHAKVIKAMLERRRKNHI